MPTPIARSELQQLVEAGAQLVEVLPKDEYDEEHLPGALHLPLKSLTPDAAAGILDRGRPWSSTAGRRRRRRRIGR